MSERPIGTCSKCGGVVKEYVGLWYGVNPPEIRCSGCGAGRELPLINMGTPPENPANLSIEKYNELRKQIEEALHPPTKLQKLFKKVRGWNLKGE